MLPRKVARASYDDNDPGSAQDEPKPSDWYRPHGVAQDGHGVDDAPGATPPAGDRRDATSCAGKEPADGDWEQVTVQ